MSTSPQPLLRPPQHREVLGELLHSMSQPLTSLRCSLELSSEEVAGRQQEAFSVALEQAERVIGMVRLMREYLDAESGGPLQQPVLLAPVLGAVVEQLFSVAAVGQIRLKLTGTSAASIPVSEARLRLALQYLLTALIELQPANRKIALQFEEDFSGFLLRAQVSGNATALKPGSDSVSVTLRRVRLAIARRVLESAGASLVFDDGEQSAFVLRIPRQPSASLLPELFS
jgi:signal transduction histidine kinase